MRAAAGIALFLLCTLPSCDRGRPKELVAAARFGIFFGGQIQERRDVPFELDTARQTQGFRVEFSAPLTESTAVEWQVDRPAARRAPPRAGAGGSPGALVEKGSAIVRAGETRMERTLPFRPGDPLGLWNVRVVVRGKVVLDRPFEVYDAAARQKLSEGDGG